MIYCISSAHARVVAWCDFIRYVYSLVQANAKYWQVDMTLEVMHEYSYCSSNSHLYMGTNVSVLLIARERSTELLTVI